MPLVFEPFHNLVGLFCHLPVNVLALFVITVYVLCLAQGMRKVTLHEQVYRLLAVLHSSAGVDAGAQFKDDVAHGEFSAAQPADVYDGLEPYAGVLVELFQPVKSQNAVLVNHRHKVGRYAYGTEVEQRDEPGEGYAVVFGKCLHKLKAHSAAAKVLKRIGVALALGVENGRGLRQFLVGHVMIANNKVYAYALGIVNLLDSLDATVENDDELHARLPGIFKPFLAHAIPFVVAVGYVIIDVRVELPQKLIHQRHRGASVYVVIAVHQDALFAPHGVVETVYGHVHILHQEGVDKVCELWTEESFGRRLRCYAPVDEQTGQNGVDVKLLPQLFGGVFLGGRRLLIIPFEVHLYNFLFFFSILPVSFNSGQ